MQPVALPGALGAFLNLEQTFESPDMHHAGWDAVAAVGAASTDACRSMASLDLMSLACDAAIEFTDKPAVATSALTAAAVLLRAHGAARTTAWCLPAAAAGGAGGGALPSDECREARHQRSDLFPATVEVERWC